MGLLEKLKNIFFEEEYVEVDEPEQKEKPKKVEKVKLTPKREEKIAKKIELPKKEDRTDSKKEEVKVARREDRNIQKTTSMVDDQTDNEAFSDRELLQQSPAFRLFDDDDFKTEEKPVEKSPIHIPDKEESRGAYGGEYYKIDTTNLYKGEQREKSFKPTPIISPIYGILDQNYSKDDIIDRNSRVPMNSSYAKKVDLDTVREKAYGPLSNDLGLSGDEPPVVTSSNEEGIQDNLLYDMSGGDTPAVEKVTIADAEEYFEDLGLEYNIDYKDKSQENGNNKRVKEIPDDEMEHAEEKSAKHASHSVTYEETHDVPSEKEDSGLTLEDNLFDLIDSMYEERE